MAMIIALLLSCGGRVVVVEDALLVECVLGVDALVETMGAEAVVLVLLCTLTNDVQFIYSMRSL